MFGRRDDYSFEFIGCSILILASIGVFSTLGAIVYIISKLI